MAIYHLTTKHISRKTGRTATAAAAYRAAAMIHDERTGETHDYRRKRGVMRRGCFYIDANGDVNNLDREQVWNVAEQIEKRKDARTAREIIVALPSELDEGQRTSLTENFSFWLSKRFGVGMDVAIHAPDKNGDERNFHAHILMTTRKIALGDDGKVILGDKSDLELSDRDLRKRYGASASGKNLINEIRQKWADDANKSLEYAGWVGLDIDHRSHAARGLQELPSIKMGVAATAMERRGEISERGEINRAIKAANTQYKAVQNEIIEQAQADERDRITRSIAITDRSIESTERAINATDQDAERIKRDIEQRKRTAAAAHSAAAAGEQRTAAAHSEVAADEQRTAGTHSADESKYEIAAESYRHIDRSARHIDAATQHIDAAAQHIDSTKQYIDAFNARARETALDIEILDALNQREVQPVTPEPPAPVIVRLPITASYIPNGQYFFQRPTVAIGQYIGCRGFESAHAHLGQISVDLSTMQVVKENITSAYPQKLRDEFLEKIQLHAVEFLGVDAQGNERMGFDKYNEYLQQKHGTTFRAHESYHQELIKVINYEQQQPQQQQQQPQHDSSYDYDM